MLPQRRETHELTDRSRCPAPLTSAKRSHVWNWFCHHYHPIGFCSHSLQNPPVFHNRTRATSHLCLVVQTQDIRALMRTLSATDRCSGFACHDFRVHYWWSRIVPGLLPLFHITLLWTTVNTLPLSFLKTAGDQCKRNHQPDCFQEVISADGCLKWGHRWWLWSACEVNRGSTLPLVAQLTRFYMELKSI